MLVRMNSWWRNVFFKMTPFLLDFTMKRKSFEKHRLDVARAANGIVLEIGFGSGLNLPYYRNVSKLYALDPSRDLFILANGRIEKAPFPVEFLQASAEQIPLADASVDAVVSTWSLCTIPHPQFALKEVLRVLKPGGIFSFIEHGKSPNSFVAAVQKCCTPFSRCLAGGCHLDREIEWLIRGSGFDIKKLGTFSTWSMPLAYMYKGIATPKKS